jgi:hypothetical protein
VAAAGDPLGTQAQRLVDGLGAQFALRRRGGAGGDRAHRPAGERARRDEREQRGQLGGASPGTRSDDRREDVGEQERLGHQRGGVEEGQEAHQDQRPAHGRHEGRQRAERALPRSRRVHCGLRGGKESASGKL